MSEHPDQLPEGALIADALKRSRLSARKAAERAGMSEGRWRQIVKGYQTVSAGVTAPVRGPAETVARMAHVVGVTPEQLEEAGREDAAAELRSLDTEPPEPDDSARLVAKLRAEADRLEHDLEHLTSREGESGPDLEYARDLLARARGAIEASRRSRQ